MSEEAKKLVDPAEVEKVTIDRELKVQEEVDPVEIASMMLTLYTPRFCALVDKLSSRQLKRVTKSLVEFPVGKTYVHRDPVEAECFAVGKNLMDAKYVLIADTYSVNREKIIEEAARAAANVTTSVEFEVPQDIEEGSNEDVN